jgi:hypothetical protein
MDREAILATTFSDGCVDGDDCDVDPCVLGVSGSNNTCRNTDLVLKYNGSSYEWSVLGSSINSGDDVAYEDSVGDCASVYPEGYIP